MRNRRDFADPDYGCSILLEYAGLSITLPEEALLWDVPALSDDWVQSDLASPPHRAALLPLVMKDER